jgi:hypothetical protein
MPQCCLELQPSPAHIRHLFAKDAKIGIRGDKGTRLFHFLAVHQHLACQDQRLPPLTAFRKATVHEQAVQPKFIDLVCCFSGHDVVN